MSSFTSDGKKYFVIYRVMKKDYITNEIRGCISSFSNVKDAIKEVEKLKNNNNGIYNTALLVDYRFTGEEYDY